MRLIKTIFAVTLMLFAATGFAAKKEKTLICHVGSEVGPGGEVYNPNCVPDEFYDCSADAGKVDLIAVSKNAKHLGNPAHYFVDSAGFEWEDYLPAEGAGDDPADFEDSNKDGIDDGCELEQTLSCPCWSNYSESDLVEIFNLSWAPNNWLGGCYIDPLGTTTIFSQRLNEGSLINMQTSSYPTIPLYRCTLEPIGIGNSTLSAAQSIECHSEMEAIAAQITWCND